LDPLYPDIYYNLGIIYEQEGESDEAIENFNKYLELSPHGSYAKDVKTRLEYLSKR
jgi:lipoprotein NlpI